jgi:hypothetical protein
MLQAGFYTQPPQGANPYPQAGQPVPPLPPVRQATVHGFPPFPALTEMGSAQMKLESIALRNLMLAPLHCHRDTINQERVEQLANRIQNRIQLPPIRAWRAPDGAAILADGFHRFLALQRLGVSHASVLVWQGTWSEALVQALLANLPHNGNTRKGQDAERALLLLAHALGRQVTASEAADIGLAWGAHAVPTPDLLRMIRLPAELEIVAVTIAREACAVVGSRNHPRRPARGGKRPEVSRRS